MPYHEKDKKQDRSQPIICHVCGMSGGTLIKDDKGYHHADSARCKVMQMRKARIKKLGEE